MPHQPPEPPSDSEFPSETLAASRGEAYAFLSRGFLKAPTADDLSPIDDGNCLTAVQELLGGDAVATLREWAANRDPSVLAGELQREFTRLFQVPGSASVVPYESVFRDAREIEGRSVKGLLMGQSSVDVQQWYRLAALDISPEFQDLPDHIALELSYLATLCSLEKDFAAQGEQGKLRRAREMQRDFLAAHLRPWVADLAGAIKEKSPHPYFTALADALVHFTTRDLAELEEALGKSSGQAVPAYPDAPQ